MVVKFNFPVAVKLKVISVSVFFVQGFQQKFAFHSKEIVAISCSWCKQAVSMLGKGTKYTSILFNCFSTIKSLCSHKNYNLSLSISIDVNKCIKSCISLFSTTTKCPASCCSRLRKLVQSELMLLL